MSHRALHWQANSLLLCKLWWKPAVVFGCFAQGLADMHSSFGFSNQPDKFFLTPNLSSYELSDLTTHPSHSPVTFRGLMGSTSDNSCLTESVSDLLIVCFNKRSSENKLDQGWRAHGYACSQEHATSLLNLFHLFSVIPWLPTSFYWGIWMCLMNLLCCSVFSIWDSRWFHSAPPHSAVRMGLDKYGKLTTLRLIILEVLVRMLLNVPQVITLWEVMLIAVSFFLSERVSAIGSQHSAMFSKNAELISVLSPHTEYAKKARLVPHFLSHSGLLLFR